MGNGIESIIKTAQSPVVMFEVPGLEGKSWSQIKQLAQDARSNPVQYKRLLGAYKSIHVPELVVSSKTTIAEHDAKIVLVDIAPEISVPGVGFVFMYLGNFISWLFVGASKTMDSYYYRGHGAYKFQFQKNSQFLQNIDSVNDNFSDYLIEFEFKVSSKVGGPTGPYGSVAQVTAPVIQASETLRAVGVLPSFFEIVGDNFGVGEDVEIGYNMDSITLQSILQCTELKNQSMGYMKNIIPTVFGVSPGFLEGNSSYSIHFRDVLAIKQSTIGPNNIETVNYNESLDCNNRLSIQNGKYNFTLSGRGLNGTLPSYNDDIWTGFGGGTAYSAIMFM